MRLSVSMLLTVDIGNTEITIALFEEDDAGVAALLFNLYGVR